MSPGAKKPDLRMITYVVLKVGSWWNVCDGLGVPKPRDLSWCGVGIDARGSVEGALLMSLPTVASERYEL